MYGSIGGLISQALAEVFDIKGNRFNFIINAFIDKYLFDEF